MKKQFYVDDVRYEFDGEYERMRIITGRIVEPLGRVVTG